MAKEQGQQQGQQGDAGQQGAGTDPQGQQGQQGGGGAENGAQGAQQPTTFAEWLKEHDTEGVGGQLYAEDVAGLRKALSSERETNKVLGRQLRDAAKAAPDDATKEQLNKLADERDAAVQRADFYAAAVQAGCANIDAAYHIARGEGAFTPTGQPDMEAVRAKAPQLFQPVAGSPARAGQGAGGKPVAPPTSMNQLIRQAAGRST